MRYLNLKAVIDFMQGFVLRDTLCHVPKLFSYLFTQQYYANDARCFQQLCKNNSISIVQNISQVGQWLWLSWQSGRFQFQRSVVRIQSSAKIYIEHLLSTVLKYIVGRQLQVDIFCFYLNNLLWYIVDNLFEYFLFRHLQYFNLDSCSGLGGYPIVILFSKQIYLLGR